MSVLERSERDQNSIPTQGSIVVNGLSVALRFVRVISLSNRKRQHTNGSQRKDIQARWNNRFFQGALQQNHFSDREGYGCVGAVSAAGQGRREEEVAISSSISIESMQRAGIVMTPLTCAFSGSPRSRTLWQTTFTSALSLSSQPTAKEAHSTAFGSPTSAR